MWAMGSPSAKAAIRQVMARLEIEAIVKGKGAVCIAVEASVQPRAAARPERKGRMAVAACAPNDHEPVRIAPFCVILNILKSASQARRQNP